MLKKFIAVLILFLACSATASAYDVGGVEIHCFASQGFLKSTDNNYLSTTEKGSFEFNEASINFAKSMTDTIRIGLQLYSFDLGDVGNNEIDLDWAYLDYQWETFLGIRVGKIKTPFGLYNEVQDYDMLHTPVLMPQCVYNKFVRDTLISTQGGGIYGNISLGVAGTLNYDAVYGTGGLEADGAMGKLMEGNGMRMTSGTTHNMFSGRLKWFTPVNGLLFSTSYYRSENEYTIESVAPPTIRIKITDSIYEMYILSTEYTLGDLTLAGEYSTHDAENTTLQDLSALGLPNPPPTSGEVHLECYYGMISYRFCDWFEAGAYYSVYYPNRHDRSGGGQTARGKPDYTAWQKDWVISTHFDITDFWIVKFETHFIDGVALCAERDNPGGYEDQHWTLFALKTTFYF